ncbi:uncharacterized protein LY89DRAFT_771627 [Mollisia scopiformis]|uniref:Uncharacterized protein n=1 Tax=Mollisia scopiformis TaxID=149040 RepID=A0A194XKL4_MOLSC|nr:uncharacterized protein LY89DRAFT_771627 [Mollisia scopiformis]KUJ20649.1 hypothetical protein LY89DRAFT_771627 [Mollisia scopiformis]
MSQWSANLATLGNNRGSTCIHVAVAEAERSRCRRSCAGSRWKEGSSRSTRGGSVATVRDAFWALAWGSRTITGNVPSASMSGPAMRGSFLSQFLRISNAAIISRGCIVPIHVIRYQISTVVGTEAEIQCRPRLQTLPLKEPIWRYRSKAMVRAP